MTLTLPSGTVTFLFTDIEGSTQLWEQHPDAMKLALARHDVILHQAVSSHSGRIFKSLGDGFQAAFPSAYDALTATLDAQRTLYREAWGETPIRVRMALHTGVADEHDNDYSGPMFNRLARLMAAGHGGQTLLSAATYQLVQTSLPPDVELRDMGERRLRSLARSEHIYQLIAPDLPTQFPPLNTLDVFRTNLPAQITSFIGRESEMSTVKRLITQHRLITLTGPGGTGKTRLSLQIAADLLDSFLDGVWFVELAPLSDPSLVVQTVANTLGLHEEVNRSLLDILTAYLQEKKSLLILDNCEHLVNAAAQLADVLLRVCPNLQLLISSREALGIAGEITYRVPSLSVPNAQTVLTLENILQHEAIRLFIERARDVSPQFSVTPANFRAVAQICSRLVGIPLAIELAAARAKMLNAEQIAERLDDRFHLLTGGSRTALPRQQTLRAMIDWSYDLLSIMERSLLVRLSIFAGGWTLEAAETVCKGEVRSMNYEENKGALHNSDFIPSTSSGQRLHPFDVLDLLTQLINKSLVVVDANEGTETRYHLLETIRQYAREKLFQMGDEDQVRDHHLDYFMQLAERVEPEFTGPDQVMWMERLEVELDNIYTALEWSLHRDVQAGLRLASALRWFWVTRDYLRAGSERLSQLLACPQASVHTPTRAKALTVQSILVVYLTDASQARILAEESIALYRELGDERGVADGLLSLAASYLASDPYLKARSLIEDSIMHYRDLADKPGLARALGMRGAYIPDAHEQRRIYLEQSLTICRELGHLAGIGSNLMALGGLAILQRQYDLASTYLEEALAINRQLSKVHSAETLFIVAELALTVRQNQQAKAYFEEGLSMMKETGRTLIANWVFAHMGHNALQLGDLAHAKQLFEESLQRFKKARNIIGLVYTLEGFAGLAVLQNQSVHAVQLFAWADVMREKISNVRSATQQADIERDLATIHTQFDNVTIDAAQAAGRAMSMDEAIAYALQMMASRQ